MSGEDKIDPAALQRITVIDALRGFALLGVILMHMIDHFGYADGNMPVESSFAKLDQFVRWFSGIFIRGKFLSIFSFLFGLSFYIQMESARKKGVDFRGRFLWRMLLLFVIGVIGTSFTYVDILTIYALFGIVMVFLFPLRNWILMLIVSLLLLGVPNLFFIGFDKIKIEQAAANVSPSISEESMVVDTSVFSTDPSDDSTSESVLFLQSAKENLTVKTYDKLKYLFSYTSNGYLILALFIMGFIVGRLRFFEQVHIRKKRNIILFAVFLLTTFLILLLNKIIAPAEPIDLLKLRIEGGEIPLNGLVSATLNNFSTISLAAALVMGFIALYQVRGARRYLELLSPYGRMGLTNYEMQNVIGAVIFSGWGFGAFFGSKGDTELFVLGLLIYLLQIIISKYWMKQFLFGPVEWLWRAGTHLKFPPFTRKKDI